jgi:ElaB/YqjD/DUF883 family membrane-anchored ribosome-binding protein
MAHSSNGSHRRIAIEEQASSATAATENTAERIEAAFGDMQDVVRTKSTEFIRQHPGASLLLAAAIGGVLGWLIKRRG